MVKERIRCRGCDTRMSAPHPKLRDRSSLHVSMGPDPGSSAYRSLFLAALGALPLHGRRHRPSMASSTFPEDRPR